MGNILEIKDLDISFSGNGERLHAVRGVSIDIPYKKTISIVGESGCGKTVTALSILGLIPSPPGRVESGEIIFDGKDLLKQNEQEMRKIRGNRISMIFQEPVSSLNPVFTIGDQIGEAIDVHRDFSKSEIRKRVIELLDLVKIPAAAARMKSYPHELSGGMCQRVMIAMALSCEPELLIADEPTTALDVTIQSGILGLINELKEGMGMSILLITHDLGIVAEVADEVYVMYAGKIVENARTRDIFKTPGHPYTLGLINSLPSLDSVRQQPLSAIEGMVPSLGDLPTGCSFQDRCSLVEQRCRDSEPELSSVGEGHKSACFKSRDVEGVKN